MSVISRCRAPLLLALALLSITLAGCGFQLRGATAMPAALEPVYVDCAGSTPSALCQEVRELLTLNEVRLTESVTPDSFVLRLSNFQRSQRATAITATAAAAEYDLRLSSDIALFAPGAVPLLADTSITANEVYRYDEANVLAKRREQQSLAEQLYQRLAQQIIFRLTPFDGQQIDTLRAEHRSSQAQPDSQQQPAAEPEVPAD